MVCDGCVGIFSAEIASTDAATTSSYQSGDWVDTGNARYIFIASPCVRFNNRLFGTLFNLYKTPIMKLFVHILQISKKLSSIKPPFLDLLVIKCSTKFLSVLFLPNSVLTSI